MSIETWFRIIFAVIAIGTAIYLVAALVGGRSRVGGRTVDRRTAPRTYWGSVGKTAILLTGLAVGVIQPSEDNRLPIIFLGLFCGQLFEMLVSGTVQMPAAAFSRTDQPKKYWRWAAFHAAVVVLIAGFLIMERTGITIL
jgi:hypothetical protein